MNRFAYALLTALTLFAGQVYSAPISIGPYALDSDAGATGASFTGSVQENITGAITDNAINTYIKGDSADAAATLTFDNIALSNQSGDDLALFFLFADNTINLDINGFTSSALNSSQLFVNPVDPFVDIGEKYIVTDILLPNGNLATADLSVIFVDLDDYGVSLNQSITEINVGLGLNAPLMTYAIGLHDAVVVPLPPAFLLLLSGLAVLRYFPKNKITK